MKNPLYIVCEGTTDTPLLRKIATDLTFDICGIFDKGGSGGIKKQISNYNNAARNNPEYPWLVVLDLDQKECAPLYIQECLPNSAPTMIFRIAVREIESWIIADRENFSKFFRIPLEKIPFSPDEELNPKEKLIQLIKDYCRDKSIKTDMIPIGTAKFGRGHLSQIQKFLFGSKNTWQLKEAIKSSKSLKKTVERLSALL